MKKVWSKLLICLVGLLATGIAFADIEKVTNGYLVSGKGFRVRDIVTVAVNGESRTIVLSEESDYSNQLTVRLGLQQLGGSKEPIYLKSTTKGNFVLGSLEAYEDYVIIPLLEVNTNSNQFILSLIRYYYASENVEISTKSIFVGSMYGTYLLQADNRVIVAQSNQAGIVFEQYSHYAALESAFKLESEEYLSGNVLDIEADGEQIYIVTESPSKKKINIYMSPANRINFEIVKGSSLVPGIGKRVSSADIIATGKDNALIRVYYMSSMRFMDFLVGAKPAISVHEIGTKRKLLNANLENGSYSFHKNVYAIASLCNKKYLLTQNLVSEDSAPDVATYIIEEESEFENLEKSKLLHVQDATEKTLVKNILLESNAEDLVILFNVTVLKRERETRPTTHEGYRYITESLSEACD